MTDPWSVQSTNEVKRQTTTLKAVNTQHNVEDLQNDSQTLGFEDSFIQDSNSNQIISNSNREIVEEVLEAAHIPLPDSDTYLQSLERKLEKLKNSKLVDALSEKRNDCLRSMLQDNLNSVSNNDLLLELETSVGNSDSTVQNLYRQIQPVQPVTVGETVNIVKFDQLEEQRLQEANEELEEDLPENR